MQKYGLWVHIVDTHIYVVYHMWWAIYCGGPCIYCGCLIRTCDPQHTGKVPTTCTGVQVTNPLVVEKSIINKCEVMKGWILHVIFNLEKNIAV